MQDTSVGLGGHRRARRKRGLRRRETQSTVRTMPIVVVHEVGDDAFEVLVIQNEEPVETLRPNGSYEPLRYTIRLADGSDAEGRQVRDAAQGFPSP